MNRHSNIRRMVSLALCLMLMLCTAATAHADTTAYAKGKADVYVEKSFAIQSGREVRIMVKPEDVNDAGALVLAREVCHRIEREMEYPGQIKVNVIRETRAVEFAK